MLIPIKVTSVIKGRKSAHGGSKGAKASFIFDQEAPTVEEAVKALAQQFPSSEGYKVELCPAP